MNQYKRLWIALAVVIVASFAVLGGFGYKAISNAPPIPREVITRDGRLLFGGDTIQDGQGVWQSIGGQEVGSIFGHGAYVAPDWTADWLHRESMFMLDVYARDAGAKDFASLGVEQQAALRARLEGEMRTNTYDPATGRVTVSPVRAAAFDSLAAYYADVFAAGRNEYAIPRGARPSSSSSSPPRSSSCRSDSERSRRTTASKAQASTASRSTATCHTRSRARGTRSSDSSGSRRRGSRPDSSSRPPSAATSRRGKGSASTFSSPPCFWSSSGV